MTVMSAVLEALQGRWLTSYEVQRYITARTGYRVSESACTARIRDLRKVQYGAHDVRCRYADSVSGKKTWQYGIGCK